MLTKLLKQTWGHLAALAALVTLSTATLALPPTTSGYVKDEQTTYNNDDTTDAFSLVKTVACFMKNTRPELYAGQGKYVACPA